MSSARSYKLNRKERVALWVFGACVVAPAIISCVRGGPLLGLGTLGVILALLAASALLLAIGCVVAFAIVAVIGRALELVVTLAFGLLEKRVRQRRDRAVTVQMAARNRLISWDAVCEQLRSVPGTVVHEVRDPAGKVCYQWWIPEAISTRHGPTPPGDWTEIYKGDYVPEYDRWLHALCADENSGIGLLIDPATAPLIVDSTMKKLRGEFPRLEFAEYASWIVTRSNEVSGA